jgi:nucleoside-diphosphate kinase
MFSLDKPSAEEFLEIYRNLIPEFPEMVVEMTMGPCVALEIR